MKHFENKSHPPERKMKKTSSKFLGATSSGRRSAGCRPRPDEGGTRRNSISGCRPSPPLSVSAASRGSRVAHGRRRIELAICPSGTIIRKGDAIRNGAGDDAFISLARGHSFSFRPSVTIRRTSRRISLSFPGNRGLPSPAPFLPRLSRAVARRGTIN